MDPNLSLGKICLGENIVVISSDKVEGLDSPEFQDIANSRQKKETKAMVFYQMDTEEVSDSKVQALEHEVRRRTQVVKKERTLIVALREDHSYDHLLDFNLDDVPLLGEEGLPSFVCKMGKSSRNKKRAIGYLNFFYQDIGTSSSAGGHLTQEEATEESISDIIEMKFDL
ncbi:hypothetical protein Tco_1531320 [Tanacetum coccineum]